MAWIASDEEERKFLEGLRKQPDRTAGMLAASFIDNRLNDALRARWYDIKIKSEQLSARLFNYSGPLGSFGTRIDIGFCIGLYSGDTFKDLHSIRKIRNEFAHKIAEKDFDTPGIVALVKQLKLPDKFPADPDTNLIIVKNDATPFERAAIFVAQSQFKDLTDTRTRFMRCSELLTAFLLFTTADPAWNKPHPLF